MTPPAADVARRPPAPRSPLERIWRGVKKLILHGSKAVGLYAIARDSRWRRRRLLVLGYHGISTDDEHEWNAELFMPAKTFRRRLEILRDGGYAVLRLADAVERLYRGTLPPRSVVLTFDDGGANFYTHALPLLREFGFPATVYLTTYYTRSNRPVFDIALPYILWQGRGRSLSREIVGESGEWWLGDPEQREQAHRALLARILETGRGTETEDELLEDVAARIGVDLDEIRERRLMHLMNEAEVVEIARQGVSIQLHSHRHRTPRNVAAFVGEVELNRERIAELTGHSEELSHFCYPNGWHAAEFVHWLRELGVRSATTCQPGIASPRSEPILLPRLVDTTLLPEIEFEGWLTGVAAFLPRRVQPSADDI